ncbi:MAG: hypothetical protein FJY85_06750, partial [Deltaproteobacteria bacterium]|nr:hypothetical protein [Deltaproteobacteria bacterium]
MLITRRLFASINAHRLPRAATIAFSLLLLSTSPDASIATTSELQEQVKRIEQALRGLGLDPILSRTHWGAYNLVDEKTELWSALQKPGSVYRATVVSVSQSEEIGRKIFDAAVRREMENKSIFREKGSVDVGLREKGVIVLQGPLLDEGYSAGRCRALLLSGNVVVLVDQVNVSQTLVEKNDMEKARNMALEEARKGRGYVEEASKRYVEALKSHKGFFPDDHWDVKIGFEGQSEFGQGDDFSFHGKVQRLGKPVPGAQVEFKLVAPMTLQPEAGSRSYGMFLKSGKIETDAQGSWSVSGFFTPDASLSLLWETEVTASVDGQVRFASKFFTVKPLELSEDYVKRRIRDISENWKKDPSIPNGMDDSRVAAIVNSKQFCDGECHPELPPGMKVNLCSVAGQSEVTEFD